MQNITLSTLLAILSVFGFVSFSFAVATPTMPDTSGIVFPSSPPRPIMPLPSNGICPVDCICYPATTTPTTTPPVVTPGGGSETTGIFSAGFGNILSGTVISPTTGGGGGGGTGGGGGGSIVPTGSGGGGGTVLGAQTFNPGAFGDPGGIGDGGFPDMPNTAMGDERDLFYALLLLIVAIVEVPFLINKFYKRLKVTNETPKYI